MGFVEKIKSSVEMWRIEKYTKRRPVLSPDFEQKGTHWTSKKKKKKTHPILLYLFLHFSVDKEFYRQHYKDGVYLHHKQGVNTDSFKRKTSLLRTKSEKIMRSSENYNVS